MSFRHDLTPDPPVVLDAGYEFDKAERRRIDEQIRDLQQAALQGFMRGTVTAYFVAAADLARGDVVCLAGSTAPGGERRVTKATAAAMASAGTPVGIVMADAPKGASVRVAIAGVVPATVTGLLAGEPGFVRVSSIGRCERVATPAGGDVLLGSIDAAGTLAMAHGRGGTGGGGGVTELDGDATGPSDDTTVVGIQGTPVDSTPPEDGQVLAFVEADGMAKWVTPGGGGGIDTVATLDDLRAIPSSALSAELRFVEETGILWRYDAAGGADEFDDGKTSVKPTDKSQSQAGRWRPVTLPGMPAWEPMPGMTIPTTHVGASLIVMGAKPIVDGQPSDAASFAGFLVDMGDEAGVKRPYALVGLSSDGIEVGSLNMATMRSEASVSLKQAGIRFAPGEHHEISVGSGRSGHDVNDVSLDIAAGDQGDGDADGTLSLRGGGWGALIDLEGRSSGGNAWILTRGGDANIKIEARGSGGNIMLLARGEDSGNVEIDALGGLYISAPVANISGGNVTIGNYGVALIQCVASPGVKQIGFFGSSPVARPVVSGSRSDGSAWESLLNALVALGLVEDQTTP